MTDTSSPLSATDPDALTLLYDADPLPHTDAQVMDHILDLRRRRNEFASAEAVKALQPKKTRTKAEPQSAASAAALDIPPTDIDLGDI